jgi:hypothetical protein
MQCAVEQETCCSKPRWGFPSCQPKATKCAEMSKCGRTIAAYYCELTTPFRKLPLRYSSARCTEVPHQNSSPSLVSPLWMMCLTMSPNPIGTLCKGTLQPPSHNTTAVSSHKLRNNHDYNNTQPGRGKTLSAGRRKDWISLAKMACRANNLLLTQCGDGTHPLLKKRHRPEMDKGPHSSAYHFGAGSAVAIAGDTRPENLKRGAMQLV